MHPDHIVGRHADQAPGHDVDHSTDIRMSRTDYQALDDAHDHCLRALSAVNAAQPFDSEAMVALDSVRKHLAASAGVLTGIHKRARVTE